MFPLKKFINILDLQYKKIFLLTVLLVPTSQCLFAQSNEAIKKIDQVRIKMQEIVTNGDLSLLSEFYSANATVNGYDTYLSGINDIKSYWENVRGEGVSWEWKKLAYAGNDYYVTQTGISILTLKYGTTIQTYKTQFSVVWEKQKNENYKIVSDFYRSLE